MLVITVMDSLDASQEVHRVNSLAEDVRDKLDRLIFGRPQGFDNPFAEEGRTYQIRLSEKGSPLKRATLEEMSASDDQLELIEEIIDRHLSGEEDV